MSSPRIFVCPACMQDIKGDGLTQAHTLALYSDPDCKTSVKLLQCQLCEKDVAIWHDGRWRKIADFLKDANRKSGLEISQAMSELDHRRLFVLSQVCHNQHDISPDTENSSHPESAFLPFACSETVHLVWKDSVAVGFYSLRKKDSPLDGGFDTYALPVVDTVYIRRQSRGQGLGTELIRHAIARCVGEDVGFSSPVSWSLLRVVHRLLEQEPKLRDRLWECEYDGSQGYRRNLWFHARVLFGNTNKRRRSAWADDQETRKLKRLD